MHNAVYAVTTILLPSVNLVSCIETAETVISWNC